MQFSVLHSRIISLALCSALLTTPGTVTALEDVARAALAALGAAAGFGVTYLHQRKIDTTDKHKSTLTKTLDTGAHAVQTVAKPEHILHLLGAAAGAWVLHHNVNLPKKQENFLI